jgi:hypothetical protein
MNIQELTVEEARTSGQIYKITQLGITESVPIGEGKEHLYEWN